MYVKLRPGVLNPSLYPPHPISIYTCEVTIAPRVCGGYLWSNSNSTLIVNLKKKNKKTFNDLVYRNIDYHISTFIQVIDVVVI